MSSDIYIKKTRTAFLWTYILGMPFWAIYTVLLFILYKDLHASPMQISIFIALRPMVSIFSLYWSYQVNERRDRLRGNIMWAGILGPLPFLFFPFIDNVWYIIFSAALYMTLVRGVFPAWMEILKLNLPLEKREKLVSYGTTFSYVGGGFLSLIIGCLLDDYPHIWRWIFPFVALLSVLAAYLQAGIPIRLEETPMCSKKKSELTLAQKLISPWKNIGKLLHERPDFKHFHFGFMLGGFGLVIIQPALPQFFISVLHLSYTELATAMTLCKGIAFGLTSSSWAKWLHKVNIHRFSSLVALLAGVFPLLVIYAQIGSVWIYIAYLLYGVMQSGSELCWHLSGPVFAKTEDSSLYSSVNLAVVGLRGCIAPLLGGIMLSQFSSTFVLCVGSALSLMASSYLYAHHKKTLLKAS